MGSKHSSCKRRENARCAPNERTVVMELYNYYSLASANRDYILAHKHLYAAIDY